MSGHCFICRHDIHRAYSTTSQPRFLEALLLANYHAFLCVDNNGILIGLVISGSLFKRNFCVKICQV